MINSLESLSFRPISKKEPYKIIFVCLGNICRSPTAEGIFIHLLRKYKLQDYFEIDSAGTSAYHEGERADSRSRATAQKHSVDLPSRSRRFTNFDTNYFDLIIAMDEDNLTNIQSMMHFPDQLQKVYLMMQFDSESGLKAVPDPYYGGSNGFENVFEMLEKACESLLNFLKPHISK
ncbi:MAG: low molecular weight phosphotyrosine protein phosphatase [Bacteroidetes bacterium]|nr:low molecular weight phosphotyrosine protein phosphatase [Bacteroidota bacterium]